MIMTLNIDGGITYNNKDFTKTKLKSILTNYSIKILDVTLLYQVYKIKQYNNNNNNKLNTFQIHEVIF